MNVKKTPCIVMIAAAVGLLPPAVAVAEYATIRGIPITEGQMRIAEPDLERLRETAPEAADRFVLKETRVEAEISGVLARVRVEQVFENPYPQRLEATYVFPLPEDAAVDRYWFQIGEQIVRGVVKKRHEARYEYERARDEGRKASLLEQERANVFTQSVANIPPNQAITVHLEYAHPVQIDGDRYAFRFPMVVGPRFIPGRPLGGASLGRGWARDTDQVPDASRITPKVFPAGMRDGNDVSIHVKLDAGMPIHEIVGVTHELDIRYDSTGTPDEHVAQEEPLSEEEPSSEAGPSPAGGLPTAATIRLKHQSTVADKDFVVEYRLAGQDTTLASLAHRSEAGGYFAFVLQPKWQIETAELTPREVILLLDTSGSMQGPGISQLRLFAGHVLENLNPQDTFRLVAFSNTARAFRPQPTPVAADTIAAARQFVRALGAGGGTQMLPALKTALGSQHGEQGRPRYLVLVTDALVGNDDSILGYLGQPEFSDVRVFPVAMGAAPNHYLINRAAEISRGFAIQVTNGDNPAEMADRFNRKISTPYMTDLELDWGPLAVHDVLPQPLPDLYADRPLVVMGRYDQPGTARVKLKGNIQGQAIEAGLEVTLPEAEPAHDSLGSLWAGKQIRHIWNRDLGCETDAGRNEITRLGLTHQLVTRYTSFVAVEVETPEQLAGNLHTQAVATMLPEGMTDEGVGLTGKMPAQVNRPAVGARQPSATSLAAAPAAPAPPPARTPSRNPAARPSATHFSGPPPVSASPPPQRNSGSSSRKSSGGGGGGGGGAVEWLFLAALGGLGGGRLLTSRRRRNRSDD